MSPRQATRTRRPAQPAGWLNVAQAEPGDMATHPASDQPDTITAVDHYGAGQTTITWQTGPAITLPTSDALRVPLPKPGWQPRQARPADGPRHDAADYEPELRPLRRNVPRKRVRR